MTVVQSEWTESLIKTVFCCCDWKISGSIRQYFHSHFVGFCWHVLYVCSDYCCL